MYNFSKLLLIISLLVHSVRTENWCLMVTCLDKHIACNSLENFDAACPPSKRLIDMDHEKNTILEKYNKLRNTIAGGDKFKPAARMATIQWDEKLAYLATLNAKRCAFQRDQCRNTNEFLRAGQNIALFKYRPKYGRKPDSHMISDRVDNWLAEIDNAQLKHIESMPREIDYPTIAHFAMGIVDMNTHMGCVAVSFDKDDYHHCILTCNFASRPQFGQPIYAFGSKPGDKCETGKSPEYPNLCSVKEKYKTDKL